jgi:hypothetical protein
LREGEKERREIERGGDRRRLWVREGEIERETKRG